MKRPFSRLFAALLAVLALSFPANAQPRNTVVVNDPWETYNRAIFSFNEQVDRFVLKPVAKGYVYVVPEYGRERVHNVLTNLRMPIVFFNSTLQGDPENAMSAVWSFILNSTFGVLGIFDFAGENTGLRVHDEDFGQTLAVWGVGSGPYFVLPILGPSTIRDTAGIGADWLADPYNYLVDDDYVIARIIVRAIDQRAGLLKTIDDVYATSFDPYATIRSGYFQRRAALVENRTGGREVGMSPGGAKQGGGDAYDDDPAAEAEAEGLITPSASVN